jgi:predicted transcriptional regulator
MPANKKIKETILHEIELLPENEQQTVLGIVENYLHSQADETEWSQLPLAWKIRIEQSLKQADEGQFILNEDAVAYIRKKYRPND